MRRTRRALLAAGAAAAGGVAVGAHGGRGTSAAAPSAGQDRTILDGLLQLEDVQVAFYRQAIQHARLDDQLLAFARTVGGQEVAHAAFLADHLGRPASARAGTDFGGAVRSPGGFRAAALELEEAVLAAYIGQGANLTAGMMRRVVTVMSVEARQTAWLRDLTGALPAPGAADAARGLDAVLEELRGKGWLR